jgi:hypothetical protein
MLAVRVIVIGNHFHEFILAGYRDIDVILVVTYALQQ